MLDPYFFKTTLADTRFVCCSGDKVKSPGCKRSVIGEDTDK